MLQELRLGHTRVAHEEDIDVATNLHAILHLLRVSTDHLEQERLLNLVHSVNFRANVASELFKDLKICGTSCFHVKDPLLNVLAHDRIRLPGFVSNNLVGVKESVLGKSWSSESKERLGKKYALNSDGVTRRALAHIVSNCSYLQSAWNVADGHLIAWLLNLDVLVGLELARAENHAQLSTSVVRFALGSCTLKQRHELFGVDHLIDFEAA